MKIIKEFIKKNPLKIIVLFCLIATIAIAEDVFEKEIMKCDVWAYSLFVNILRNDKLTIIMKIITNFGSAIYLIVFTILSFILIKNKRTPICITINLVTITVLNLLLKNIVERPRPDGYRLITEIGYSFPSGHSMVSVAFYGFIIYLIYKYVKDKKIKWISCIFLSILVLLIGSSRIYLGVHYASDVIAGALISIAYLICYTRITNKYILKKE